MHIFYLINTKNVGKRWIDFIDPEENATIYLFCNANIRFSLTDVQTILSVSSKIHIIQCIPGNNSMDFFIIMKLGELLSLHKKAQFYIISGDHDFDGVITEYKRSGHRIARITQKTKQKKQCILAFAKKHRLSGEDITAILDLANKETPPYKQTLTTKLNTYLFKTHEREKATKLIKAIKSELIPQLDKQV